MAGAVSGVLEEASRGERVAFPAPAVNDPSLRGRGQLVAMLVVPSTQSLTVVVFIKLGALFVVAMFFMALAMAFSLCKRDAATGKKYRCCDGGNPFSYFHENSHLGRYSARLFAMTLKVFP